MLNAVNKSAGMGILYILPQEETFLRIREAVLRDSLVVQLVQSHTYLDRQDLLK